MPCCVCGFDKKSAQTKKTKKIFYLRYPTGKAEEAEKWMNAILEYKPDFIPPKHPGFVCSQHFILGSKTNLLPTVPGNSLEEHQKGRAADESTATVSEDHSYATTNGLNKSTANLVFTICLDGAPSSCDEDGASSSAKRKVVAGPTFTVPQPTIRLTRCADPGKGVMCMEHWTRNCPCMTKPPALPNGVATSSPLVKTAVGKADSNKFKICVPWNSAQPKPSTSSGPKSDLQEAAVTPKPVAELRTPSVPKPAERPKDGAPVSLKSTATIPAKSVTCVTLPPTPKTAENAIATPGSGSRIASTKSDLDALLQNRQLMTDLIKEEDARPVTDDRINLIPVQGRRHLLVEWKRFHRAFHLGRIHIRILYASPRSAGFVLYVMPSAPTGKEDSTTDIHRLKYLKDNPIVVRELLDPILQPRRLKNRCFAALQICQGSEVPRWKLMSCIQLMTPTATALPVPSKPNNPPIIPLAPIPPTPAPSFQPPTPQPLASCPPTSLAQVKVVLQPTPSQTPQPSKPTTYNPPSSSAAIAFPAIQSTKLVRQGELRWKVRFQSSTRQDRVSVMLPLTDDIPMPRAVRSELQWWMVALSGGIPEAGLIVRGLSSHGGGVVIPRALLERTASTAAQNKVSTYLRLQAHLNIPSAQLVTPCCLYGWPRLPGFVILGPLPLTSLLPENAPWIMRLPLVDSEPAPSQSLVENQKRVDPASIQLRLQAEEVLKVQHDLFLPQGRIFESLDEAQRWLQTVTEKLNQPQGFQCDLNENCEVEEPGSHANGEHSPEEEDMGKVEKILLGHIHWLACLNGPSRVPIYGHKLIRVRHPFPTVSGHSYSLFRTAEDAQAWGQSIREFITNRLNPSGSVPDSPGKGRLIDPSVLLFEPIVNIESSEGDVVFSDGEVSEGPNHGHKRARLN